MNSFQYPFKEDKDFTEILFKAHQNSSKLYRSALHSFEADYSRAKSIEEDEIIISSYLIFIKNMVIHIFDLLDKESSILFCDNLIASLNEYKKIRKELKE